MIRIKENIESLNAIREKCKNRQTDFNQEELTHLNLVFIELQKSYGKRYVRPLDRSCSHCISTFMGSVYNYIMGEEIEKAAKSLNETTEAFKKLNSAIVDLKNSEASKSIVDDAVKISDVVTISSGEVEVEQDENEKLTLPELRAKYPNVKARSKEKFLRLLNEN